MRVHYPLIYSLAALTISIWWAEPRLEAAEDSRYAKDMAAFVRELDTAYPFFDLKDIRGGWPDFKRQLARKTARCSSDSEFLELVMEAVCYLRDGHVDIVKARADLPAPEPEYYPGLSFLPATGKRVVILGAPEKLAAVLKPGTIVTHIDRRPARALLERMARAAWERGGHFSSPQRARLLEYRIALRGKQGDTHRITFLEGQRRRTITVVSDQLARGWPHTYNMPRSLERHGSSCWYRKLESGVGYIWLRRIDGSTAPGLEAATKSAPDARGWILDLRGNGGGGYDRDLIRKISELPRPVAVLIDAGCYSAGETLARDCVRHAGARLIGSRTAGSSSAKKTWTFPSGLATLSLPVRSRGGLGRCIEFFGIEPQQSIEAVPEEVARGENSGILRAEEFILGAAEAGAP